MSICLNNIKEEMLQAGVQDPAKDIDIIYAYMREHRGEENGSAWRDHFISLLKRRVKREPWERIIGRADFFEAPYHLSDCVFKPGFETETTVEYALIAAES